MCRGHNFSHPPAGGCLCEPSQNNVMSKILVDGNRLSQEPAPRGISLCFLHGFRNLKFDKHHVRILSMSSIWTDEGDCLYIPFISFIFIGGDTQDCWSFSGYGDGSFDNFQGHSRTSNFVLPNLTGVFLHDRCVPHRNSTRQV